MSPFTLIIKSLVLLTLCLTIANGQEAKPYFIIVTKQYTYPGTNLTSTRGMVEKVFLEEPNSLVLRTPKGRVVRIPKQNTKRISNEDAASLLMLEREAMALRLEAGIKKLADKMIQTELERDNALRALAAINRGNRAPIKANPMDLLEGGRLVADDGTFLGLVSRNSLNANSLSNNIGKHGSNIGADSIFNNISKYGSNIGEFSPFNNISNRPPKIFLTNGKWIYLTKNTLKTPRIDPNQLVAWLKSN